MLTVEPSAVITEVKHLSSYNWIEAPPSSPTIVVPGSPALWSPPPYPQSLTKDSGFLYIAQNAARYPEKPMEPLFRALYITDPSFDIRSTDMVTDRNNIRKLLDFVDPDASRNGRERFAISIEVIKNTAILCREETKTTDFIKPNEFRGYGHNFEKAYTTEQIRGSTGHHRIISYRFGDINFIVRYETDGYLSTGTRPSPPNTKSNVKQDLSGMLAELNLSSTNTSEGVVHMGSRLVVKQGGQVVPLESTLEIKTRVSHKPLAIDEVAAQLWASQTPKLVRAYHKRGTFQLPQVQDVAAAVENWQARKQNDLRRLGALIRRIIQLAKECGGRAIIRYNVEEDRLVINKAEREDVISKDLYANWEDVRDVKKESSAKDKGVCKAKHDQSRQRITVSVGNKHHVTLTEHTLTC